MNEQRLAAIAATATPPAEGDFVWDGKDEDDRPLTKDEMRAAINKRIEVPTFSLGSDVILDREELYAGRGL